MRANVPFIEISSNYWRECTLHKRVEMRRKVNSSILADDFIFTELHVPRSVEVPTKYVELPKHIFRIK